MSDRENEGLGQLFRELDKPDWPAPELLARYATDPNGLDSDARSEIDRALASGIGPALRDEIDTLRGFDFGALNADRGGAERDAERSGVFGWRRLMGPTWGLAAAAAAAVAAWFLVQNGPVDAPEPAPKMVEREREKTPGEPVFEAPKVPDSAPPNSYPAPDSSSLAEVEATPSADPGEGPIADPRDRVSPPPESQIARLPTPAEGPPTRPSAPESGTETVPDGAPDLAPAPTPEARPEILIAMAMPAYQPAFGIEDPGYGEWIVRSAPPELGANPSQPPLQIEAITPHHVTRVSQPSPPLFWNLTTPPTAGRFELTILDEEGEAVALDVPLATPGNAGLQRIDLAALGIRLPASGTLRWSVAYRPDPESPPAAFDFGWVQVRPLEAAAAAPLASLPIASRVSLLAEAGCFNEALDAALIARAERPSDPNRQRAVNLLLEAAAN